MGWLITLAVLILLGCIPLGVGICYDEDGVKASVIASFLHITVFPRKKKKPKEEKKKEPKKAKKAKKPAPDKQEKPKEKKGGSITKFLPFVKEAFHFLGDFRRKLRVNKLDLAVTLAGGDPADLAVNYSRAWAALGNLQPQLNRFFVIKKQNFQVNCDFCQEKTLILLDMEITITLGRLLGLAAKYGWRMGRLFLAMKKNEKKLRNEKGGK